MWQREPNSLAQRTFGVIFAQYSYLCVPAFLPEGVTVGLRRYPEVFLKRTAERVITGIANCARNVIDSVIRLAQVPSGLLQTSPFDVCSGSHAVHGLEMSGKLPP